MIINLCRYCKNLCFVFLVIFMMGVKSTLAAAPDTSCPSGFVAIDEPHVTIATSCSDDTIAVEESPVPCLIPLASDYPSCIMYAPVGMAFTDDSGTYQFTEACAME